MRLNPPDQQEFADLLVQESVDSQTPLTLNFLNQHQSPRVSIGPITPHDLCLKVLVD